MLSIIYCPPFYSDISYITHSACIPVLCQCLAVADESPAVCSSALACLEKLAAHSALKDAIRKHEGIRRMCEILRDDGQVVSIWVLFIQGENGFLFCVGWMGKTHGCNLSLVTLWILPRRILPASLLICSQPVFIYSAVSPLS